MDVRFRDGENELRIRQDSAIGGMPHISITEEEQTIEFTLMDKETAEVFVEAVLVSTRHLRGCVE